jgi:hypothetical protein
MAHSLKLASTDTSWEDEIFNRMMASSKRFVSEDLDEAIAYYRKLVGNGRPQHHAALETCIAWGLAPGE